MENTRIEKIKGVIRSTLISIGTVLSVLGLFNGAITPEFAAEVADYIVNAIDAVYGLFMLFGGLSAIAVGAVGSVNTKDKPTKATKAKEAIKEVFTSDLKAAPKEGVRDGAFK